MQTMRNDKQMLHHQPLVSIIMPTYNRAELIMESIASIQAQSYTHWELIIVDDGSTDHTAELIMSLLDERIFYYYVERTGIGGFIKNIGIEKSTGTILAFNDSDDSWHPQKLATQVKALLSHTNAQFSLCGGYNFNVKGIPINHFYKSAAGTFCGNVFLSIFQSQIACFTQSLVLYKNILDQIGLFKEEQAFSDVEFIARLAYHYDAVICYEPLVFRRLHAHNYIHQHWERSYQEGARMIRNFSKNKMLPLSYTRSALFKLYINYGEKCLHVQSKTNALFQFIRAWYYKPLSFIPVRKSFKAVFT
jgi:glycosyltransferase involved in cell wall biosynthesis